MSNAVSLVVLSCLLTGVQCRSSGASSASCASISPDHSVSEHNATAQTSTVPYVLTGLPPNGNYTPGMSYNLALAGNASEMFRGFLVVAMSGGQRVGRFTPGANGKVTCNDKLGVTHTSNDDKTTVSFTWTAPPEGTGEVEVRLAVVMVKEIYWADELADTLQEGPSDGSAAYTSQLQGTLALILLAALSLAMMLGF